MIGILAVIEAETWLSGQISIASMGCKSAVSSVATFLPMADLCGCGMLGLEASVRFICGLRGGGPGGNPERPFVIKDLCPPYNRRSAIVLPDRGDIEP